MNEEDRKIEERLMPWRFWFFAAFSLFLIITFVYYLPLRFEHQDTEPERGGMPHGERAAVHGAIRYHEENEVREGLAVNLNVTPVPFKIGTPLRLDFFVNEKPGNVSLEAQSLELDHEKLMHVVGVRNDMNEFFHIHPVPTSTPGVLSVLYSFAKPGTYKIWSEIKKGGVHHIFGHPEIMVGGEGEKYQKEVFFARSIIVGNYQVLLDYDEPIVKGRETNLTFDIHDVVGREIEVESFLAADMHLSIIKDDLKAFIHTHPVRSQMPEASAVLPLAERTSNGAHPERHEAEESHATIRIIPVAHAHGGDRHVEGDDKKISFHVTFPEAGVYKLFAQFRPKGIDLPLDEALTASFWIRVEEGGVTPEGRWWINLFVSLVLIVAASWLVKRYLTLKASNE